MPKIYLKTYNKRLKFKKRNVFLKFEKKFISLIFFRYFIRSPPKKVKINFFTLHIC